MTAPEPEQEESQRAETQAPETQPAELRESHEQVWIRPPFQPLRAIAALALTAAGFALYEFVLANFWSSAWMGIHQRTPWPAFALIAAAIVLTLAAIRVALAIRSSHAKLGFSLLAFGACIVTAVGGGRFISYTVRGTRNPPFAIALKPGDRFPQFTLPDQDGLVRTGPQTGASDATLIFIYRGDYCPFARFELHELTERAADFRHHGVSLIAISADPVARSQMLAHFLDTRIPLLSDEHEAILHHLGLVQRHRNGEPDNAIPAFIVVDREGIVRWMFTSPYYRELPRPETLLEAADQVAKAH